MMRSTLTPPDAPRSRGRDLPLRLPRRTAPGGLRGSVVKFYLAGAYDRWPELRRCRENLLTLGHEVLSQYLVADSAATEEEVATVPEVGVPLAQQDMAEIEEVNALILFTEPALVTPTRGGAHVEFGMALALGRHIAVVGPRMNAFHTLPEVRQFASWSDALRAIEQERWP